MSAGARRRRCHSNVDVVARALKFAVFLKNHPSHAADVVARVHALSPGRRRHRPSAEVWDVCEKTPLLRGTRRRTGACIVAHAHELPPGRRCRRPSGYAFAGRRRLWSPNDASARPQALSPVPVPFAPNFTGYKRRSLPFSPHFASIRSFLAWTCPLAAPCKNLTDRTLAFFSYCVVVYVNRIGASSITFIFSITSIHITYLASCKNGEAEEGDKGMRAMVYVATGWTYSEMCVLWKHNAI